MSKKLLSLIITCYNEEENIEKIYQRIKTVFQKLPKYDFEIVFVDNNSEDNSFAIYNRLAQKDKKVKVILMSRNFGSPQPSFLAGLTYAKGEATILLHGDIQDPPELIPKFIDKWEEGYQVIYGIRKSRKGYNFLWNFFYKSFYYLLHKLSYINIPLNAGDFSLIDKVVVKELLKIEEYDYYLRCLRAYVGFRQIGVEYVREKRQSGRASDSLLLNLWWAKTIIINFSLKPLEWIAKLAFLIMLFAFIFIIYDIAMILIHGQTGSAKGIPTVVILVLFMGGVQLLSLSIIAEYLAKIFLEIKRRPRYIIKEMINIKKEES